MYSFFEKSCFLHFFGTFFSAANIFVLSSELRWKNKCYENMILIKRITVYKMQFEQKKGITHRTLKLIEKYSWFQKNMHFFPPKRNILSFILLLFLFGEKKLICWIIYFPECKLIFLSQSWQISNLSFPWLILKMTWELHQKYSVTSF